MASFKKYFSAVIAVCLIKLNYCQVVPNSNSQPSAQQVLYMPPALSAAAKINYVRTWEPWKPLSSVDSVLAQTVANVKQTTAYVDGLGRPVQTVTKQISPNQKDMVAYKTFDNYGRETLQYLPYISDSTSGYFKTNPFLEQQTYYSTGSLNNNQYTGEQVYYGRTAVETSPLGRQDTVMAPGNSWAGSFRGVRSLYLFNTADDAVRVWTVADAPGSIPVTNTAYNAGELYKNVMIDEHGKQVIEYKDKEGKVILKKVQLSSSPGANHTGWLCTYYVYDIYSQLRVVMQPRAVDIINGDSGGFNTWTLTTALLDELCFRYEYDQRNRMIIKKVPGAGEVWMVYDNLDRLVMSQDSMLRAQNKWLYTRYDALDRPFAAGLLNSTSNRATHQSSAYSSTSYPDLNNYTYEELTHTYFDDYTYSGAKSYDNSDNSKLSAGSNPFPETVEKSLLTYGLVTGTKTKVLNTSTYIVATSYYDNKGRTAQTLTDNIKSGLDQLTNQYDFTGKILSSYLKHSNPSAPTGTIKVLTKMLYDNAGRLLKVWKQINDNGTDKQILENAYDELGELKSKKLSPAYNSNAGLETLNYEYNIRGWLVGINKGYADSANNSNWFGQALSYDYGFSSQQYNGNISGIKWRSKGDGERRAYGFTYDNVNRFLRGDFTQRTGSAWNTSSGIDFTVKDMSYDANGNILTMSQKGLKPGGSSVIDSLVYGYTTNSNKLNYVTDKTNDATTVLGDFKETTNNTSQDYSYDGNGSLAIDNNKAIGNIHYNHLNLPDSITVTGKGAIKYTYDAAGIKLKKIVVEGSVTTTTTYISGFEYKNDTLQSFVQEEGRIRKKDSTWAFDYFIKDHLGNVRMVLTDEQKQDIYPAATLESATYNGGTAISVEDNYYTIDPSAVVDKSEATNIADYQNDNGIANPNPNSDTTANSAKLYKLGIVPGHPNLGNTGLGIALKVMSGDKVDILAKSYYYTSNSGGFNYSMPVGTIISGLLNTPAGGTAGSHFTTTDLSNNSNIVNSIDAFLTDANRNNDGTSTTPKAYINFILFDEHFKFVSGGFSRVSSSSGSLKDHYGDAAMQNIAVTKNGYLYVYCSNQSPVSVFFDNLQVVHTRGPVLEETHYYPFGLTMNGISSKALAFGNPQNKFKFNGIEQNNDFDLNMYDAHYRNLDPQTGRFWQIDPKPDESVSLYAAMANNPILFKDPLGDTTWVYNQNGAFCGVVNDKLKNQIHYLRTDGATFDASGLSAKGAKTYGKYFRKVSKAFIGNNSVKDLKNILDDPKNKGLESLFVGKVGADKEIRFTQVDVPNSERTMDEIKNPQKWVDNAYSSEEQGSLFMAGHTHTEEARKAQASNSGFVQPKNKWEFLKQSGRPSNPVDYSNMPRLSREDRFKVPLMIMTRYGFTVYKPGEIPTNSQYTFYDKF